MAAHKQTHCKRGHLFCSDTIYIKRDGRRRCKLCLNTNASIWVKMHPERHYASGKRFQKANPDKMRASSKKWHLAQSYWTPEQYDIANNAQGGKCAICRNPCSSGRRLAGDHDHETRVPRGLLCIRCNQMLGCALDNPSILEVAADYLRRYGR